MTKTFIWPTNTRRITSPFGPRRHPISGQAQSMHYGIDIADPGTRPIYAAADGVVSRSYVSTSYGEVVFIRHTINGETWETVYAHMRKGSRRALNAKVKQGDRIGTMGNTGNSTGQHLHFEIHKGGLWNINKTNAVDPQEYLDKDLYPNVKKANLTVDGRWGPKTTSALQDAISTITDGVISDQVRNQASQAISGVEFGNGSNGSLVIKNLQRLVGSRADGLIGPNTVRSNQKYLGTVQDGVISTPRSLMVEEMQRRLNAGTFKR